MSMRDIDDLLNDFEEELGKKQTPSQQRSAPLSSKKPASSVLDDMDDLLKDLKTDDAIPQYRPTSASLNYSAPKPSTTTQSFPRNPSNPSSSITTSTPISSTPLSSLSRPTSAVTQPSPPIPRSANTATSAVLTPKAKCVDLIVAGTEVPLGLGSITFRRACDRMRCTSCDWKVYRFENYAWGDQTDYLFLRNNIPDFERLKPNLVSSKGSVAYACQCSWKSAYNIERVDSFGTKFKWVCSGH
eukprot:TRINITY_DN5154_c0_g1_i2.p1 TRINITY_DN5154_c0_g1~~TRINITY_DN5154_c0_g1_i2.p1  ORF type:complete len:243 (+),score=64.54 TRINITY_DN5154_c0_g1_i2:71-799(+)